MRVGPPKGDLSATPTLPTAWLLMRRGRPDSTARGLPGFHKKGAVMSGAAEGALTSTTPRRPLGVSRMRPT